MFGATIETPDGKHHYCTEFKSEMELRPYNPKRNGPGLPHRVYYARTPDGDWVRIAPMPSEVKVLSST